MKYIVINKDDVGAYSDILMHFAAGLVPSLDASEVHATLKHFLTVNKFSEEAAIILGAMIKNTCQGRPTKRSN